MSAFFFFGCLLFSDDFKDEIGLVAESRKFKSLRRLRCLSAFFLVHS